MPMSMETSNLRNMNGENEMSLASTTVFLYVGMDNARRLTKDQSWAKASTHGHIELVDWLETMALNLERQYDAEFADLDLDIVFDYEVTEELGAWLYENPEADAADFAAKARDLVAECQEASQKHRALWAENDARLSDETEEEPSEYDYCLACNGSGEGAYDGSACKECNK